MARAPLGAWIAARPAGFATALGWCGLALCVALPGPQSAASPQPLTEALRLPGVYLGLAAMFVSTFAPRSGFRAFCALPWVSLVGGACYSIYLVHLQVTQVIASLAAKLAPNAPLPWVVAIFALSASLVVALGLTYYVFVERRFMTRDWHVLAWAAVKSAFDAAPPEKPAPPKLAETEPDVAKRRSVVEPRRRAGAGR